MKRIEVNSKTWRAFALAVEARLLSASMVGKGSLAAPRARPGKTTGDALNEAAAAYLRWLQQEQAEGRQLDGPPPLGKTAPWDGEWAPNRARRRYAARGGKVSG